MTFITAKQGEAKIYKQPKLSSPTLYFGCLNETDDCCFMWSNKKLPDYESQPYTIVKDQDAMVSIEEKGAFYKVVAGSTDESIPGYVAKSATKLATVDPIRMDDIRKQYYEYLTIDDGPYAGLVIRTWSDEAWDEADLLVGHLSGSDIIFSHRIVGRLNYDNTYKGLTVKNEGEFTNIEFGPELAKPYEDGFYQLDLSKLTRAQLYSFLQTLKADQKPNHLEIVSKIDDDLRVVYSAPIAPSDPLVYSKKTYK